MEGKAETAGEWETRGRGGTSKDMGDTEQGTEEQAEEGAGRRGAGALWGPRTELFSLEMMAKSSGDTSCNGGKGREG